MSSTQSAKWGVRYGASLLLVIPLFAHAQFAVVSQHASAYSYTEAPAVSLADSQSSDEVDSVTLNSYLHGYWQHPGIPKPGGLSSGSWVSESILISKYSSTITPNFISIDASSQIGSGTGAAFGVTGGRGLITLDVLVDTDASYSGNGFSFRQVVTHLDGSTTSEEVPTMLNGVVSLVAGRYVIGVGAEATVYPVLNPSASAKFSIQAVPEPATWGLMSVGLTGLALLARRRKPQLVC